MRRIRSLRTNQDGYAVFTVLCILTIMGLLMGMVLQYQSWRQRLAWQELYKIKAYYAAESGLERAKFYLAGNDGKSAVWTVDTLKEVIDSASDYTLRVKRLGGYIEVVSEGRYLKHRKSLRTLMAQKTTAMQKSAISLLDTSSGLVLAGATRITGDICLGQGEVTESKVKGMDFTGEKNYKVIKYTPETKPGFDLAPLDTYLDSFMTYFQASKKADMLINHSLIYEGRSADLGAYRNKTIYVEGDLVFNLEDTAVVSGPVTFIVERDLTIGRYSRLSNMVFAVRNRIQVKDLARVEQGLLYSTNQAWVMDSARVQGQFMVDDSLVVSGDVVMEYPSFLYNRGRREGAHLTSGIVIRDRAAITGTILYHPPGVTSAVYQESGPRKLSIGKETSIKGFAYCFGELDLNTKLSGHLAFDHINYQRRGTTYRNWLVNQTIDRKSLPEGFLLPVIFSGQPELAAVLWEEL
jgi:hypothetical protein